MELSCLLRQWTREKTGNSIGQRTSFGADCPSPESGMLKYESNFSGVIFGRELLAVDNLTSPKTIDDVIVDHPGGLHVCIANRRADKFEAALLQVFT